MDHIYLHHCQRPLYVLLPTESLNQQNFASSYKWDCFVLSDNILMSILYSHNYSVSWRSDVCECTHKCLEWIILYHWSQWSSFGFDSCSWAFLFAVKHICVKSTYCKLFMLCSRLLCSSIWSWCMSQCDFVRLPPLLSCYFMWCGHVGAQTCTAILPVVLCIQWDKRCIMYSFAKAVAKETCFFVCKMYS